MRFLIDFDDVEVDEIELADVEAVVVLIGGDCDLVIRVEVAVVILGDIVGDEVPVMLAKVLSSISASNVSSIISVRLCTVGGRAGVPTPSVISIRRSMKSVLRTSPLWSS